MKIAVHIPVWGRHKALSKFAKSCEANGLDMVFAITSNKYDREVCTDYGFKIIRHPNHPFGAKLQAGVDFARDFDFDALLLMGSDNTLEGIAKYVDALEKYDFIACGDCSFIDIYNGREGYWPGYTTSRRGEPAGAGRCFRRDLLDKLDWNLWRGASNTGVDNYQWNRLHTVKHKKKIFFKSDGVVLTDWKDNHSKNKFDKLLASIKVKD